MASGTTIHIHIHCTRENRVAPEGVDLVLDCLCGDDSNKGYNLLKPMGRYVLFGELLSFLLRQTHTPCNKQNIGCDR